MPISVPTSAQGAFAGQMESGAKIELPFAAPAFYILNGDAKLAALKNYLYFGGFAASITNIKAAAETWENCPYPIPGFAEDNLTQKDGTVTPSLAARSLQVAPIGMRQFSTILTDGKTKRVAPFTKGARPAIQVLVILGYKDELKRTNVWAPAMLTAKGFQVNHIQKAFTDWKKAITPFMKDVAPGMPSDVTNLFWMHIGTFGPERKAEQHGESTITPVSAFIPDNMTAQQVENQYVGSDTAEFMAALSIQSAEWLKAYSKPNVVEDISDPINNYQVSEIPPEDEIPF